MPAKHTALPRCGITTDPLRISLRGLLADPYPNQDQDPHCLTLKKNLNPFPSQFHLPFCTFMAVERPIFKNIAMPRAGSVHVSEAATASTIEGSSRAGNTVTRKRLFQPDVRKSLSKVTVRYKTFLCEATTANFPPQTEEETKEETDEKGPSPRLSARLSMPLLRHPRHQSARP